MEDGLRGDVSGIAPSVTRGEAGVSEPEMRPIFITNVQTFFIESRYEVLWNVKSQMHVVFPEPTLRTCNPPWC